MYSCDSMKVVNVEVAMAWPASLPVSSLARPSRLALVVSPDVRNPDHVSLHWLVLVTYVTLLGFVV